MCYFSNKDAEAFEERPINISEGIYPPMYNTMAVLRENTLNAFADIYQLNKTLDTETSPLKITQDKLVQYLLDINPHMFFSVENIEQLAQQINNSEEFRSLVFNLTDIAMLNTVAENIDYINDIAFKLVHALELTKVADPSKIVYDARLITGSCLNKEDLIDLISFNPFVTVLYMLCTNKVALLKIVTEI